MSEIDIANEEAGMDEFYEQFPIKEIKDSLIEKMHDYLGEENLRFFKHLKGLTGTYSPVLKLNQERKGLPAHPVHFREGMQIRNFLRGQSECEEWNSHDFDNNWIRVIEKVIEFMEAKV